MAQNTNLDEIEALLVEVNDLLQLFNYENPDSDMLRENIILSDSIEKWLNKNES